MKLIIFPLLAYFIVCVIAVLIPASDGYNTVGWKLYAGQLYAVPTLLIVTLITYYFSKRKLNR